MNEEISARLKGIAQKMGVSEDAFKLDYPDSPLHGDVFTNAALVWSKKLSENPRAIAEKIIAEFQADMPASVAKLEIAGPGFINFWLKQEYFSNKILDVASGSIKLGASDLWKGKEIMVEYTDPNIFKVFHIGHLMSNAIGESISRLIESGGAKVIRICYPSDIGLHIAKSLWAIQKHTNEVPKDSATIQEKTAFLGKMYVEGTQAYEKDESVKDDIDALNKVIYERTSPALNELYEKGRKWSLDHFDELYNLLGTKFDDFIYESEMAPVGLEIVNEQKKRGVFTESEGATVFKGEDYDLHTRVFVNSKGLPTYEAKDIGLNVTKFKKHPQADRSIIITASEQNDYFKVIKQVISLIDLKHGMKTTHIGHGMMRFVSGKMSSRTGNVITAESLIQEIREMVREKIADRNYSEQERDEIADTIAVGAIKYTILRSSVGSDIIFDSAASISFEGDSGPYLQYAAVRANSLLEKAERVLDLKKGDLDNASRTKIKTPSEVSLVEKLISKFADITERARAENSPHIIANFLIEIASAYNRLYGERTIIDEKDELSPYYICVTRVFRDVLASGLWMLGIRVPSKM